MRFIVKIYDGNNSIASGILIQNSYILTSAHNINNLNLKNITIEINFGEYKDKLFKINNYFPRGNLEYFPRGNLEYLNQGFYQDFIFL